VLRACLEFHGELRGFFRGHELLAYEFSQELLGLPDSDYLLFYEPLQEFDKPKVIDYLML